MSYARSRSEDEQDTECQPAGHPQALELARGAPRPQAQPARATELLGVALGGTQSSPGRNLETAFEWSLPFC